MTRLWLVRLGRNGEYEAAALQNNALTVGFGIKEDISHLKDRDALVRKITEVFPDGTVSRHRNLASQLNQLIHVAQTGDLVVCPLKTASVVAIGRLSGPYQPGPAGEVTRPVEWLKTDVPRDAFQQDLLYSFGAFMTVCEISRNNALARVMESLKTGRDPGDGVKPKAPNSPPTPVSTYDAEPAVSQSDLSELARDQIEKRIGSIFSGHDLTRLVAAILNAQGYRTRVSPPGSDNGIDIVAGSGPLGLGSPRTVVQVKSGSVVVDQPALQSLIGCVQDTHADHGLIVSWAGYTPPVRKRLNELFFRVRLWGRPELIDNLLAVYDQLPEDIRAELPLKRTWMLVLESDDETAP